MEHRCVFVVGKVPCEKIARFKYGKAWLCADHYDGVMGRWGEIDTHDPDGVLEDSEGKWWLHYGPFGQ